MYGYRQIRVDELDQLDALLRVHGDHQKWHLRSGNGGATEMDQHQINVLALVSLRYLLELVYDERIARNVDSEVVSLVTSDSLIKLGSIVRDSPTGTRSRMSCCRRVIACSPAPASSHW